VPAVPTVMIVVASVSPILVVAIAAIIGVECGLRSKRRRKQPKPENEQNTAMDPPQQQPDGSPGFSLHKYNTINATVDNHSYDKPEPPNEEIYQNVTWR
jgi:hypothetical protein